MDSDSKRQISFSEAKKFCEENKLAYIETSAKNGTNIKKLFETITSSLFDSNVFSTNKDKTVVIDQPIKLNVSKKSFNKCCK